MEEVFNTVLKVLDIRGVIHFYWKISNCMHLQILPIGFTLLVLFIPTTSFAQSDRSDEALGMMAYNSRIEFVNTLTLGITTDAIRENSTSFLDNKMFINGVLVGKLTAAQVQGINAGRLAGRMAAVLTWGLILFGLWFRRTKKKIPSNERQKMLWVPVVVIILFIVYCNTLINKLEKITSANNFPNNYRSNF